MTTLNLKGMRDRAKRDHERLLARNRRRYQMARDFGFSAREARVLASRSEAVIKALAKELADATQTSD